MNPKHIRYLLIAILAVYIPIEASQHQDFDIFLLASKDFLQGGNIFEHSYEDGFHFFYSPLFATVLVPFTFLPVYLARIIWLTLNVLAFFRVFKLVKSYINFTGWSDKQKLLFDVTCIVFSAKLLLDNFHNGQMTIFMLLFMLEGLRLIEKRQVIFGTALIALGINFKFLPLVMLPYLFYNKQIRACVFIAVWYVAFLLLPALVHGWEHNQVLLSSWLHEVNPSNTRHVIDTDETTLCGLTTVIPTLLMDHVPDVHALSLKRNVLNLDAKNVGLIINVTRFFLLAFSLYFLRRRIFSPAPGKLHQLWELSYFFMLIPLLFPHQQHYAFFLLFPASVYILYSIFEKMRLGQKVPVYQWILLSFVYILTNAHLLLGEFREYYDHYKIITYGALFQVILIALVRPERDKQTVQ